MKAFSFLNTARKRVAVITVAALAMLVLPLNSAMAAAVLMEGSMGVANQTRGETKYKESTNASYDEVVKFQVFYHNRELATSDRVAKDFKIKIDMPTQAGKSQTVQVTMGGSNTNTIKDSATVNLDRADAKLEFIPGSVYWKHNVGTRANIDWKTEKIADSVILNGAPIENVKPCHEFEATVTFMARVKVPAVSVDKFVRVKGQTNWSTQNTAKPGETLEYQIAYKNIGNTTQNKVVIRDNLPPRMQYVAGSTKLKNSAGTKSVPDGVTTGGVIVGNYLPGGAAYMLFEVKVPAAEQLACGKTEFRNVGIARPEGMNEYYNTAITTVTKECAAQPAYSCDLLDVTAAKEGRTVTISDFKYTATNGATFKHAVIDWGDNSADLTTNNVKGQKHSYAADGTYTIKATAVFTVNGKDVPATSAACAKSVTFTADEEPVVETPETPETLVETGAGDVIALFAAVTAAGALAHRFVWSRVRG